MDSAPKLTRVNLLRFLLLCREIDKGLARHSGLGIDELHCLCVLYLDRPSCVKNIYSPLGLGGPRTSKLLRSLEGRGLLIRTLQFDDHRKERVTLTQAGRRTAESILEYCAGPGMGVVRSGFPDIIASLQSAVRQETVTGSVGSSPSSM